MKTHFTILLLSLLLFDVTRLAAQFGPVSFSPDGKFIAFNYSNSGSCFIYEADLQTGAARRITKAADGCESDPAFSNDGKVLAYSYAPHGNQHSNLYVVDADGSNSHLLLQADANDMYPVFAPDGRTLYFMRSLAFKNYSPIVRPRYHDFDLYRMDLKSHQVQAITHGKFYDVCQPSVSPDGKNVIFKVPRSDKYALIEVFRVYSVVGAVNVQSELQPRVPGEPASGPIPGDVQYLPNGTDIIFQAASNGSPYYNYDIYRMNVDGSHLENLTKNIGYADGIRPSPDGKTAMFLKGDEENHTNRLYKLELATREVTLLPLTGIK